MTVFDQQFWLGKTDRADFHIVATSDGLRWTRTIRRIPVGFDAAILNNVRNWPWNVSYGQIGTKSTPLMTKNEDVALPLRWQVHYVCKSIKSDSRQLWKVDKLSSSVMLNQMKVEGIRDRQGLWMRLHLILQHTLQAVLRPWHHKLTRWTMTPFCRT